MNKKKVVNIYQIMKVILEFLLIVGCYSVYFLAYRGIIYVAIWVQTIICILCKVINQEASKVSMKSKPLLVYILILILVTFGMHTTDIVFYSDHWVTLPLLFIFFMLCNIQEKRKFLVDMGNIILVLVVFSTIIWLIGPVLNYIRPNSEINIFWGRYTKYYGYYYLTFIRKEAGLKKYFGFAFQSNTSFFSEAPITNVIYTLGYVINLFIKNKKSRIIEMIFVFAIVTTCSMTGIIFAFTLFLGRRIIELRKNKMDNTTTALILKVFLPILIGIVALIGINIFLNIKEATDVANYNYHLGALQSGFWAFLKKPMFGYGFNFEEIFSNTTSGLFKILTHGGIVLFLLYLFPYFSLFKYSIREKDIGMLFFTGTSFLLLVLVIYQYTPFCMFILAFGMSYYGTKKMYYRI